MANIKTTAAKCPTCDSPRPDLHPAVQYEGEVQVCKDAWHRSTADGRRVLERGPC